MGLIRPISDSAYDKKEPRTIILGGFQSELWMKVTKYYFTKILLSQTWPPKLRSTPVLQKTKNSYLRTNP